MWEAVCNGWEADINATCPTSRRDGIDEIASALKREREEAGIAAVLHFWGAKAAARAKRRVEKGA